MKTYQMEPLDPADKLIKNYVKDQARFVECWVFEKPNGDTYSLNQDQNGNEWVEQ